MKLARSLPLILALSSPAWGAVQAQLQPSGNLEIGEAARLIVTVDGNTAAPETPRVDGAQVQPSGEMSQLSSINGQIQSKETYLYTLVPTRTGKLTVPPIAVGNETSKPLEVSVTDTPGKSATSSASAPSVPPQSVAASSAGTHAFLQVDLPKKTLYVGQSAPVTIRAYFRGGTSASLQGEPRVTSDAFTLSDLTQKPAQQMVAIGGVPYLEARWTGTLAPAKPTTDNLAVELPVEIAYRDASPDRPHRSLRDLIDADLFAELDSMSDLGQLRRRHVTLQGNAGKVRVEEPPAAGRPADYSGAVGSFQLSLEPVTSPPRVGEPLVLTVRVQGTGNFDHLALHGVDPSDNVKTYPGKTTFTPGRSKIIGTRTFTQTLVPTREGKLVVPPLTAVYFDPAAHAYRTARTEPLSLDVLAAPAGGTPIAREPADAVPESMATGQGSAPSSTSYATLEPLVRQPRFWFFCSSIGGLTLLLAALGFARRSPRLTRRAKDRQMDREVDRHLEKMDAAAKHADRSAFFTEVRLAVQLRLGARWGVTPEAVTSADVQARMGEQGLLLGSVLDLADRFSYGSGADAQESLDTWQRLVRKELAKLGVPPAPHHSPPLFSTQNLFSSEHAS